MSALGIAFANLLPEDARFEKRSLPAALLSLRVTAAAHQAQFLFR
jgi:hypothetical protein